VSTPHTRICLSYTAASSFVKVVIFNATVGSPCAGSTFGGYKYSAADAVVVTALPQPVVYSNTKHEVPEHDDLSDIWHIQNCELKIKLILIIKMRISGRKGQFRAD
jgi:hypothetical protein